MPLSTPTQTYTSDLSVITQTVLPVATMSAISEAIAASKRPNTLKAYQSDLAQFTDWAHCHGWQPIPAQPEMVAAYLVEKRQHLKLTTLRRHLATISKAHQIAGLPNPCSAPVVTDTVKGLQNLKPEAPSRAKAMTPDYLRTVLATIKGDSLAGKRDRALLLVGWCAALRRSELSALRWCDIDQQPDGLVLTIMGSKTDKTGTGQQSPVAAEPKAKLCPVRALLAWREALSAISPELVKGDQPVFRQINRHGTVGAAISGHAISRVISDHGQVIGVTGFSGHSLRRGLAQAAHAAGVGDTALMQTTRHRSVNQLRTYQGDAGLLVRAASKGLLS